MPALTGSEKTTNLLAKNYFIVLHKTPTSGGGPVKGSTGLFKPSKPFSPANGLDSIGKANAETVFEATAKGGGNSLEEAWAGRNELAYAHYQLLLAREQERRCLAHELHDGVMQQLLGINYQLADSERQAQAEDYGTDPQAVELSMTTLAMTRRDVLDIVQQLRRLISDLRPAGLEELGLTAALEGYVSGLNRENGPEAAQVETHLAQVDTTLPGPLAICLFRIAQEALRNALKHAQAHRIKLDLYILSDEIVLRVEDDGCGFCVPARLSELTQRDHFGLVTMNERVNWVRGQFSLQARPGCGTDLHQTEIRLPRSGGSVGQGPRD